MLINTLKFGPLEIPENKIITMAKPVLGFEELTKFCLVELEEFKPFMWLQAVGDPAIAFIVVNPAIFYSDYRIDINPNEIAEIEAKDPALIETYVIASVPNEWADMTINLQGPILINTENNKAKQLVLVNSGYKVKYQVFDKDEISDTTTEEMIEEVLEEPVGV